MQPSRRNFLRHLSLGIGSLTAGLQSFARNDNNMIESNNNVFKSGDHFNMSGYGAPRLDKVRIGFIGIGARGYQTLMRLTHIEGVEIKALCDVIPSRVAEGQEVLVQAGLPKAKEFVGENGYKKLCESNDIDLVYNCTPWKLHTPIAVYAMNHGKHATTEIPAAVTIDECWELVETSEKTKKHFMMMENCCYDFFELLTLNMCRNGLFGEIIHAEGAYIHDLRAYNFKKGAYTENWRLWENATRNGNLYPTHGLGPIAQCLDINRGDLMDHMVSMSTPDFHMHAIATDKAASDNYYKAFSNKTFRGNINTSIIKTKKGRTIMLQHDVTTPRPYSRIHLVSGTKGIASKYPGPERIAFGDEWIKQEELDELYKKYTPPIVKHIGEMAKAVGGHGGMDFMLDWRLIDCLRNGLPLDQDVYDAAAWSAIAPLSEKSANNKAQTVSIPDFTRGNWKTNKPINLSLEGGGNTTARNISL